MSRLLTLDAKVRVLRGHEHYWRVIRALNAEKGEWTIGEVDGRSNGDRASVRDFVHRLALGGYAALVRETPGRGAIKGKVFRLVRTSREAPRLTRAGVELPEPLQETLWRSMKLVKEFSAAQLAAAATTPARAADPVTTDSYCRRLAIAGVLKVVTPAKPGRDGKKATYRLLRGDLGPIAPKILTAKHVYDPNSETMLGVAETGASS